MTKYEEMCNVAKAAQADFIGYRQRSEDHFMLMLDGLQAHCGVPPKSISFLKWNGKQGEARQYLPADSTQIYGVPQALDYDKTDRFFHLGISITLTPGNVLPNDYISFLLCANEQTGVPMMRMGLYEKPQAVNFDNVEARNQYCEVLIERLIQVLIDPVKPASKTIGFVLGTGQPSDGTEITEALVQEAIP